MNFKNKTRKIKMPMDLKEYKDNLVGSILNFMIKIELITKF